MVRPNKTSGNLTIRQLTVQELNRVLMQVQSRLSSVEGIGQVIDSSGARIARVGNAVQGNDAINLDGLAPYVQGPDASTDGEVPVYDGITGKKIKRTNTISGIAKLVLGVLVAAVKGDADLILADQSGKQDNVLLTNGTVSRWGELPGINETKRGAAPATGVPSGKFLRDDDTWTSVDGVPQTTGHPSTDVLSVAGWVPISAVSETNRWWPGVNWWPHTVGKRYFP